MVDNVDAAITTVSQATDTDKDGMPDWWEKLHQAAGLNYAVSNAPDSDVYFDGVPDVDEFAALTLPGDDSSFLQLRIATSNGTPLIFFDSSAARVYDVVSRSNLTSGTWGNFVSNLYGIGGTISTSVLSATEAEYFKLIVREPQ